MTLATIALWITCSVSGVAPARPGAETGSAPSVDAAAGRPLFRVLQGGKWGFIDASGRVVIEPRFQRAADFSDGRAAVLVDGKQVYVDESGRVVLTPEWPPADPVHRPFSSGLAAVRVGGRFGFMDREGKLAIPARFTSVDDFSEGLAMVCDAETCAWIGVGGKAVVGPGFMSGTAARNGVVAAYLAMGMSRKRVVLMRTDGKQIPGEFEDAGNLSEGLIPVRVGGEWGYADASGERAIPQRWLWAGDFSEGLAVVKLDRGSCTYIDRKGNPAFAATFRDCGPFANGRARVDLARSETDRSRVAFIDRTGTPVIFGERASPPFDSALDFRNGLAAVAVGGPVQMAVPEAANGPLLGYVDPSGRYVWKPSR
jgi:hypothetical protein